ncbi:hypothetical protein IAQ61_012065 [Plenodomus lingam]|uniref:uncharacterized protein n=1 Tax=Leptosphaeria maculans TaxID=5022 RepID=UPI0033188A34|nr:hypothetical protein IAQ61_012065 [Plenodomus lingam]
MHHHPPPPPAPVRIYHLPIFTLSLHCFPEVRTCPLTLRIHITFCYVNRRLDMQFAPKPDLKIGKKTIIDNMRFAS